MHIHEKLEGTRQGNCRMHPCVSKQPAEFAFHTDTCGQGKQLAGTCGSARHAAAAKELIGKYRAVSKLYQRLKERGNCLQSQHLQELFRAGNELFRQNALELAGLAEVV